MVIDHVNDDLLQSGADERAGESKNDSTLLVLLHEINYGGGSGKISCLKSCITHLLNERNNIQLFNIDMANRRA